MRQKTFAFRLRFFVHTWPCPAIGNWSCLPHVVFIRSWRVISNCDQTFYCIEKYITQRNTQMKLWIIFFCRIILQFASLIISMTCYRICMQYNAFRILNIEVPVRSEYYIEAMCQIFQTCTDIHHRYRFKPRHAMKIEQQQFPHVLILS